MSFYAICVFLSAFCLPCRFDVTRHAFDGDAAKLLETNTKPT